MNDQDHYHCSAVLSKYIIDVIMISLCHALFMHIIFITVTLQSLPLLLVLFLYFGSPTYFLYYINSFLVLSVL